MNTIINNFSRVLLASALGYFVSIGVDVDAIEAVLTSEDPVAAFNQTDFHSVGEGIVTAGLRFREDVATPFVETAVGGVAAGIKSAILTAASSGSFDPVDQGIPYASSAFSGTSAQGPYLVASN